LDPINNVDRLVLVLRRRLEERARLAAGGAATRKPADPALARTSLEALAAVETVDDRQLRRALVQNILAEHLGPELINEANFHQVVESVTQTIEREPACAELMGRALKELRASAR
jgi:hypothetical protein